MSGSRAQLGAAFTNAMAADSRHGDHEAQSAPAAGRSRRHGVTLAQYAKRRYALAGANLLSGFNPFFLASDALARDIESTGQPFRNFAQYDYLAIGDDHGFRAAAAEAALEFGVGAGASRLVGGERTAHHKLEKDLARFIGTEDALAMVSGYGANFSLIGHLLTTGDGIFVDEFAHNSILVGTNVSRARTTVFSHNDLDALEAELSSKRDSFGRVLVVVEGLYSMEGDIPDLPRLISICERHDAWLMLDEAHSIGVLGQTGRGLCEHYNIDPSRVDLIVGTLSKAFATCGGFICGKRAVIEWLRYTLPGFVYSVGLPPVITAAAQKALSMIEGEPQRLARLRDISRYFVQAARRNGFDVGSAIGAGVVPVMFEDIATTMAASHVLLEHGIYVPPVVQIGVPKDSPRLRFFLSAQHTTSDVDCVFDVLSRWRQERSAAAVRGARSAEGLCGDRSLVTVAGRDVDRTG